MSILAELRAAEAKIAELKKPVHDRNAIEAALGGAPMVRKGENSMGSRPFRFMNMLGLIAGKISRERATIEYDALNNFRKSMDATQTGLNQMQDADNSWAFPIGWSHLPDTLTITPEARNLKSLMAAGCAGVDPDEVHYIARRIKSADGSQYYSDQEVVEKAALTGSHSYLDQSLGGSLVKPPEQGELIPLMRNMSVLDRAGCQQYPLPQQGKAVLPRQTAASTAYWITENMTITTGQITTGQMVLEAKKLGVVFVVPNDLFKFAGPAADALLQADGAKSLALKMDAAGLYGTGAGQPKGLTYYTGSNEVIDYAALTPAPAGLGTNGNTIRPEDAEYMLGLIEDRNFDVDQGFRFLMRGSMWRRINAVRTDATVPGDETGPFVTAITRLLADKVGTNWSGYPVIRSAQILGNLTKGSGTNLSQIWGGMWNEMIMAMYGAIEFARSPGENAFLADQTIIRGILYGDVAPRYPGSFIFYNSVLGRFS